MDGTKTDPMPRGEFLMLTLATLGMVGYGLWEAAGAAADLIWGHTLELWANLAMLVFGLLLVPAAALVRVRVPGGLPLAISALLGLQAFSLHEAAHYEGMVAPLPQVVRGAFAVALIVLAHLGGRQEPRRDAHR